MEVITLYVVEDDELYHYGVLGMKWGVRRASKQLSKATTDKERNKAVSSLNSHREKINKKMSSLDSRSEKLEQKRYKVATKSEPKIAKYKKKAAKYRQKASTSFLPIKERNFNIKANKFDIKASKLEQKAAKTRAKIEKNERLKKTFETGLNNIDKALVDRGRNFVYEA